MLKLAAVNSSDTLVDLGSGDGRIVIAAAKRYGAKAIGIELDPVLVSEARANAVREHVATKTEFIEGDLFRQDLNGVSVVTLYLLPSVNIRLKPKLLRELAPGARIISHRFDLGNWRPDRTVEVDGEILYLWIVPQRANRNH